MKQSMQTLIIDITTTEINNVIEKLRRISTENYLLLTVQAGMIWLCYSKSSRICINQDVFPLATVTGEDVIKVLCDRYNFEQHPEGNYFRNIKD